MDIPLPFRRAWSYGALALLLPALAGLGLRLAGFADEIFFGAVVLGLISGLVVVILSIRVEQWPAWLAGFVVMIVAPIGAVSVAEGQAVGPILRVPTEQAATHRRAAGFAFTDGSVPRLDLEQSVTIGEYTPTGRARRGGESSNLPQLSNTFFNYAVVPVVSPGWTPAQPVRVVAVEGDRSIVSLRPAGTAHWAEPGGLLRSVSVERDIRAVREAMRRNGLTLSPDAVVGLWVPSPGWARLEAILPSFVVLAVALVLWTGILLLGQLPSRTRARPAPEATSNARQPRKPRERR
jgi:hypothetical protein